MSFLRRSRAATQSPGIFIFGMHRSGTSAMANLLGDLGLRLPVDQMPPTAENPEGFGESVSLTAFDDELLARGGGRWDCAPLQVPDRSLDGASLAMGRAIFAAAFEGPPTTPGWVLKDPRIALLVAEWRAIVEEPAVNAIVMVRSPAMVVDSLGSPKRAASIIEVRSLGLALWERSYQQMLRDLGGADRLLFTDFDRLLVDVPYRRAWAKHAVELFEGNVATTPSAVLSAMEARLAVSRTSASASPLELTAPQEALYAGLVQATERFDLRSFAPPAETPATEALFAEHRACSPDERCAHRFRSAEQA